TAQPQATIAFGNLEVEEPGGERPVHDLAGEVALLVQPSGHRRDLLARELARGFDEGVLLVGEVEVEHGGSWTEWSFNRRRSEMNGGSVGRGCQGCAERATDKSGTLSAQGSECRFLSANTSSNGSLPRAGWPRSFSVARRAWRASRSWWC